MSPTCGAYDISARRAEARRAFAGIAWRGEAYTEPLRTAARARGGRIPPVLFGPGGAHPAMRPPSTPRGVEGDPDALRCLR